MKKLLIMSGVMLMLFAATAAARNTSGIGLYGNIIGNSTGAGGGLGLTFRSGQFPVIGVEWNSLQNSTIISGSLDAWLVNPEKGETLSYFIGIGAYAALNTVDSSETLHLGGRVPLGLQLFPADSLELFIEISPMIVFVPNLDWTVSSRLGFRVLM